jgi:hypothetical protein
LTDSIVSDSTAVAANDGSEDGTLTLSDNAIAGIAALVDGGIGNDGSGAAAVLNGIASDIWASGAGALFANASDVPSAGNDLAGDGDASTPVDNALSGRSADDGTVFSDSTGTANSSAETHVETPADGGIDSSAPTVADGAVW